MNDMIATKGHNNPPDTLDEALAPYGDAISEAESWLDGSAVENEGQMKAVDALLKQIKSADKAVKDVEESEAKPIYDQWKATKARYAPTLTDLDRIKKGLLAIVDAFKRKLAAEKAEAERLARMAADKARREAEEAARQADASNIEAMRAAAEKQAEADAAQKAVAAASKDTVKGLRKVQKWAYEIDPEIDPHGARRPALLDIMKNDAATITAFVDDYVAKHFKDRTIDGVKTWTDREAF